MNVRMTTQPAIRAQETPTAITLVGYVEGVMTSDDQLASLAGLFPHVRFRAVGMAWPEEPPVGLSAMLVKVEGAEVDGATRRLAANRDGPPVIVVLRSSDANDTRRLILAGAADVLLAPVSEAAMALSLERLFAHAEATTASRGQAGKVIGLLKAGGGVGATAIGTQLACMIASRGSETRVCFADLDLQFGLGSLYLDLTESMSLTDVLDGGGALEDAPLAAVLARHRSGVRLLAAPRDLTPLEVVSPDRITALIAALRREFAVTLIDLPTVWNAWTNQALQLCDQIVMVTNLSLPHAILAKRQLRVLALQRLDTIALTMVCNRYAPDQRSIITQKDAEKAIGRSFDLLLPDDRALMNDAVAQGCEISTIRSGSKLEKGVGHLAGLIAPVEASVSQPKRRWRWP
jgi:pilus assembly protein CpaE